MVGIWNDVRYFWRQKCFAVGIPFMMILSYITLLVNPTVGIDDTSFKLYYVDGVSPAMGRWCLYLMNKVLPLGYNPHFVEAVGLSVFCLSITLWCVVFYRMFGKQISPGAYTIFGMVMLSSPILSEVVIWYLQDGIYLGYGFTALAVLFAMNSFRTEGPGSRKDRKWYRNKRLWGLLGASLLLVTALGFYEAFMIVFLMAMMMNFMLIRVLDKEEYSRKVRDWLINLLAICIITMMFRTLIVGGITMMDHLEEQAKVLESRGLGDIFGLLAGWFDGTRDIGEFIYVLKDFFVKYYLHAIVYTPIMILVLAVGVLALWGMRYTVKKRDAWILCSIAGIVFIPWIMPVLEGWATYYRSSEYVPLLTAFAVLLMAWEIKDISRRSVRVGALLGVGVLLYWQGYEMNHWLYVDARKYENDRVVMNAIALDILENCQEGKPICVIGSYGAPESLISDVYVPEWSKKYELIRWLVSAVDEEIFEKYNVEGKGYATAETPALSMIQWGTYAYGMPGSELIKFWKMHGFSFAWDIQHRQEALELMENGPAWPKKGSIVEMEDYIIVNLGDSGSKQNP